MTEISLRPYQREAVTVACKRLAKLGSSLLVQSPTGSGKTAIAMEVIHQMLQRPRVSKVLVVTPRAYLIQQMVESCREYGLRADHLRKKLAKRGDWPADVDVLVAHHTAVRNRLALRDLPQLMVIDEAHGAQTVDGSGGGYHARENNITRLARTVRNNGGRLLGLTATPCRLEDDEGLQLYSQMHQCPTYDQLVEQGYLTPIRVIDVEYINVAGVVLRAGEYAEDGLRRRNRAERLVDDPLADALKRGFCTAERPTIVFCISRRHAVNVARYLTDTAGINTALDINGVKAFADQLGGVEHLGAAARDAFASGDVHVMVSVFKYLEGVDLPRVQGVVDLAPTMSVGRWRQKCGRASRIADSGGEALVFDAVSNARRLGSPTGDHDWSLLSTDALRAAREAAAEAERKRQDATEQEARMVALAGDRDSWKSHAFQMAKLRDVSATEVAELKSQLADANRALEDERNQRWRNDFQSIEADYEADEQARMGEAEERPRLGVGWTTRQEGSVKRYQLAPEQQLTFCGDCAHASHAEPCAECSCAHPQSEPPPVVTQQQQQPRRPKPLIQPVFSNWYQSTRNALNITATYGQHRVTLLPSKFDDGWGMRWGGDKPIWCSSKAAARAAANRRLQRTLDARP